MSSRHKCSIRSAVIALGIGLCAATSHAANPGDVLISRVASPSSATGYIELYNNTDTYIPLNGWVIEIAYANGTSVPLNSLTSSALAPHGLAFLATANYKTAKPEALISGTIANIWSVAAPISGQIQLRDPIGNSIDELAFGTVSSPIFGEGNLASALTPTTSLARKTSGTGLQDTGDNSVDFESVTDLGSSFASASVGSSTFALSPVAFNGTVYVGGGNGLLSAFWTQGSGLVKANPSFPSIKDLTGGSTGFGMGRASIRSIQGSNYLFLVTNTGALVRVKLYQNGSIDTTTLVSSGSLLTTTSTVPPVSPVVFPADDAVRGFRDYAFLTLTTSSGVALLKIPALDFTVAASSVSFGSYTVSASSPSINGPNLYIGTRHNTQVHDRIGLFRINPNTMDVLTNLTTYEGVTGSPMVSHTTNSGFFQSVPVMYVATDKGTVYARNADTGGSALSSFGVNGYLELIYGRPLSTVYLHNNILYVTEDQRPIVYALNAQTGAGAGPGGSTIIFNGSSVSSSKGIRGGVVVDPRGTLCFGTSYGWFYQIPIDHPDQPVIYKISESASTDGFYGTPTIDTVNGYVLAVNSNGYLYRMPRY